MLTGCVLLCFAETPRLHSSSPQESYLAPELKQLVAYCSSSDACEEGLSELLEDVGGDKASASLKKHRWRNARNKINSPTLGFL